MGDFVRMKQISMEEGHLKILKETILQKSTAQS